MQQICNKDRNGVRQTRALAIFSPLALERVHLAHGSPTLAHIASGRPGADRATLAQNAAIPCRCLREFRSGTSTLTFLPSWGYSSPTGQPR
jgi:hypothetical protein